MDIKEAVDYVGKRFIYRSDKKFIYDSWSVLSEKDDGKFYGDCEDFSLTSFWLHSNKNILVFLFRLLITHEYGITMCYSKNGEPHAIGSYKGLWFDNWTREALPKQEFLDRTGHKLRFRALNIIMLIPLIVGVFRRSKK